MAHDLGNGLLDLSEDAGIERLMATWNAPALVVLDTLASLVGVRNGDAEHWARCSASCCISGGAGAPSCWSITPIGAARCAAARADEAAEALGISRTSLFRLKTEARVKGLLNERSRT